MSKILISMVWYREGTYPILMSMFDDAENMPSTYHDWLRKAQETKVQMERNGQRVVCIDLQPQEFRAWCAKEGLKLDAKARSRFAAYKANTMSGDSTK